ncbi:MAG: hypothetical protein JO149_09220, partial [Gammaproteobacteria bacterium]|nr:hypothetical protein [Gammaproteobacteria bacterium]
EHSNLWHENNIWSAAKADDKIGARRISMIQAYVGLMRQHVEDELVELQKIQASYETNTTLNEQQINNKLKSIHQKIKDTNEELIQLLEKNNEDIAKIKEEAEAELERKKLDINSTAVNSAEIHLRELHQDYEKDLSKAQNPNIKIFAPAWVEDALKKLSDEIFAKTSSNSIRLDIKKNDDVCNSITIHNPPGLTLQDLQMLSRNEAWNTHGIIILEYYDGLNINEDVIYAIKDLVKHCVIAGKTEAFQYGGYPKSSPLTPYTEADNKNVIICDLSGLQFQQNYNTGRLVLINSDSSERGFLDKDIYRETVGEEKKFYAEASIDKNRYIKVEVFDQDQLFDTLAFQRFVAQDFILAAHAINAVADPSDKQLNFKFLKYGAGYFASAFPDTINNEKCEEFIGNQILQGVYLGLEKLIANDKLQKIKRIEFPFYNKESSGYQKIETLINNYNSKQEPDSQIILEATKDHALKPTAPGMTLCTTNNGDPHVVMGNEMKHASVDASIAEDLVNKGNEFSAVLNSEMQQAYVPLNIVYAAAEEIKYDNSISADISSTKKNIPYEDSNRKEIQNSITEFKKNREKAESAWIILENEIQALIGAKNRLEKDKQTEFNVLIMKLLEKQNYKKEEIKILDIMIDMKIDALKTAGHDLSGAQYLKELNDVQQKIKELDESYNATSAALREKGISVDQTINSDNTRILTLEEKNDFYSKEFAKLKLTIKNKYDNKIQELEHWLLSANKILTDFRSSYENLNPPREIINAAINELTNIQNEVMKHIEREITSLKKMNELELQNLKPTLTDILRVRNDGEGNVDKAEESRRKAIHEEVENRKAHYNQAHGYVLGLIEFGENTKVKNIEPTQAEKPSLDKILKPALSINNPRKDPVSALITSIEYEAQIKSLKDWQENLENQSNECNNLRVAINEKFITNLLTKLMTDIDSMKIAIQAAIKSFEKLSEAEEDFPAVNNNRKNYREAILQYNNAKENKEIAESELAIVEKLYAQAVEHVNGAIEFRELIAREKQVNIKAQADSLSTQLAEESITDGSEEKSSMRTDEKEEYLFENEYNKYSNEDLFNYEDEKNEDEKIITKDESTDFSEDENDLSFDNQSADESKSKEIEENIETPYNAIIEGSIEEIKLYIAKIKSEQTLIKNQISACTKASRGNKYNDDIIADIKLLKIYLQEKEVFKVQEENFLSDLIENKSYEETKRNLSDI